MKIRFRTNLDLSMADQIVMDKIGATFTEAPLIGHKIKWAMNTGVSLLLEVVRVTHEIIDPDCPTREILVELHLPHHWDSLASFQKWYDKHKTS